MQPSTSHYVLTITIYAIMSLLNINGSWSWQTISSNNIELTMTIVIVSVLVLAILRSKLRSSPTLPPGPLSLPILGYLPFLGKDELHKQLTNMGHHYGPIFKFYVGSKLFVIINTPDLARVVLRDQDKTFGNRMPTVATSVLTYGGEEITFSKNSSTKLRKIFVHEVLSKKNIDLCSGFRRDAVRKTVKNVYSKIGTPVSLTEITFSTVANAIQSMVWGNTSDDKAILGAEFQIVASKISELTSQMNISDLFPTLAWFDLQGIKRDAKKQHEKLDQIFTRIIDSHMMRSNFKISNGGIEQVGAKDLLQILLELKDNKVLNLNQIKAFILDIMIAGTDATTTLIEWTMTEIIKNHHILERIQAELTEVVGVNNIVEESHLQKLHYLNATIKETFRLHPVGPLLFPRSPSEDCMVDGYIIPKESTLSINYWAIHRDPRYWDNPLEFNPQRFLNHEGTNKYDLLGNNLHFQPFGSGRRMCPGLQLADKMETYILASFLHSFNWSLPKGEKLDFSEKFSMALKKAKPLIVIASPRMSNMII